MHDRHCVKHKLRNKTFYNCPLLRLYLVSPTYVCDTMKKYCSSEGKSSILTVVFVQI